MSEERNILNFIHTLCANGESGRLEILAGAIQGELSFAHGKLVDARFGHLMGFRAINAVAAMRDARFSFDPAFTPIGSGLISPSERVVLKQFFGIETAATSEYVEPAAIEWTEEAAPVATGIDAPEDAPEEVTIVRNNVPAEAVPIPLSPPSRFSYGTALAVAVFAIVMTAAAAIFINRAYDSRLSRVAASVESRARPEPVQQQPSESPVVQSAPIQAVPAAARVKEAPVKEARVNEAPVKESPAKEAPVKEAKKSVNTAPDLSGNWNVVNSVDSTAYRSFKNMKIGFALAINQTGSTFIGSGHKVSENGRRLPVNSRTPIQVKGSINGDRIEATFFEEGTGRKSNGKFVWRIDRAGRGLTGNFATTAARSSGKSAAIRL